MRNPLFLVLLLVILEPKFPQYFGRYIERIYDDPAVYDKIIYPAFSIFESLSHRTVYTEWQ